MQATSLDEVASRSLLEQTGGELKTAIVASVGHVSVADARGALARTGDSVRDALATLTIDDHP
jgi:N-acetylmuramic acid 6-phosphate etherase